MSATARDLTNAPTGGGQVSASLKFFINSRKTVARSAAKFHVTSHLSILRVVCKWWPPTFQGQVARSLGMTRCQVTFFAYLSPCQSRNWWPIILKLGGWCKAIDAYNLYISDFFIGYLRSGQFCDLPIIKQVAKNQFPHLRIRTSYFIMNWVMLRYCWWSRCKFCSVTLIEVIWGHKTSSEVTNRFWLITHDWKELHTSAWCHFACIVTTNPLICNMIYLVQHLTSDDLDLRSNIDLTLLRSSCAWFNAPWRDEHAGTRIRPLAFLVQKLFAKKDKNRYFDVFYP